MTSWIAHPTWTNLLVSDGGQVKNTRTGRLIGTGKSGRYFAAAVDWDPVRRRARTEYVHVLVLETFVGPRPEAHDADHIDHNRENNSLSNLRRRPTSENRADTSASGGATCPKGHDEFSIYRDARGHRHRYCRACARIRYHRRPV